MTCTGSFFPPEAPSAAGVSGNAGNAAGFPPAGLRPHHGQLHFGGDPPTSSPPLPHHPPAPLGTLRPAAPGGPSGPLLQRVVPGLSPGTPMRDGSRHGHPQPAVPHGSGRQDSAGTLTPTAGAPRPGPLGFFSPSLPSAFPSASNFSSFCKNKPSSFPGWSGERQRGRLGGEGSFPLPSCHRSSPRQSRRCRLPGADRCRLPHI